MVAEEIIAALRAHHERMEGDWTLLEEALAIDVLAFHLGHWPPGPAHRRVAFEVKVTREDFRAELDRWPDKARRALDYSHELFFVTPEGLLRREEITGKRELWVPVEAGLMEVAPDGTVTEVLIPVTRMQAQALSDYEISLLLHQAWHGGRAAGAHEAGDAWKDAMMPRGET